MSSIKGIRSQQIINLRRKYQRILLLQTIIFYSIWLILWSPYVLAFQFINVNTTPGIYTSLINYLEITIDPVVVAALDIRFLKVWQTIWRRIRGRRQTIVVPLGENHRNGTLATSFDEQFSLYLFFFLTEEKSELTQYISKNEFFFEEIKSSYSKRFFFRPIVRHALSIFCFREKQITFIQFNFLIPVKSCRSSVLVSTFCSTPY